MPAPKPTPAPAPRPPLLAWALVVAVFGALFGFAPGGFDAPSPAPPAGAAQALRAAP